MKFSKDIVAVQVNRFDGQFVVLRDADGADFTMPIRGLSFTLSGHVIGKVIEYSKTKRYRVRFGNDYTCWVKTWDCHSTTLPFPAEQMKSSVAYDLWANGRLVRGYIDAPRRGRRKLGVAEYAARVDIDGKSVYGTAKQDSDGKLYFVPSANSKYANLI